MSVFLENGLKGRLLRVTVCLIGCVVAFASLPASAQDPDAEVPAADAETDQDPPEQETTDPVPVDLLPVGTSVKAYYVVDTVLFEATLTGRTNPANEKFVEIQIKMGEIGGGGIEFNTDILRTQQKVAATFIGDNALFISGKVAIASDNPTAPVVKKLITGLIYKPATGPLKFKGAGFSNSAKAFEKTEDSTSAIDEAESFMVDPCAEDPDDLSLSPTP